MPREFVGYYRVSTQKQGQSGLGLEAQQEQVRLYVASVGGTVLAEHIEVEGGKLSDRPVLAAALRQCSNKKATLVIAKLDRLARSVAFVATLMEAGTDFIALDAPFANKLLLHVLSAVAEHEREMISQRTKAALAAAKARGVKLGTFGVQLAAVNRAAADTFAADMREQIETLIEDGCTRLQDIADGLNCAGLVTREGCDWGPAAVHRIMRRLDLRTPFMSMTKAA